MALAPEDSAEITRCLQKPIQLLYGGHFRSKRWHVVLRPQPAVARTRQPDPAVRYRVQTDGPTDSLPFLTRNQTHISNLDKLFLASRA